MASAKKTKEILVTTENRVGVLKEISSAISSQGANITAVCAYGEGAKAHFMIVTDNNQKATASLKGKSCKVEEKDVVEVHLENAVGALDKMSAKIAQAGIDINYIYGTVGEDNAPARLILSSNNDDKVLAVLK